MRRLIFPIVLGLGGCAILMSLGLWQLDRLAWKMGVIRQIEARIGAEPTEIPQTPDPEADKYRPVTVSGRLTGAEVHVLTSLDGPGYRVIGVIETGDRRVMADLGYVPLEAKQQARRSESLTITGHLHWPQETDAWTPEPDPSNIWFAREVPDMAEVLGTEETLVIAKTVSDPALAVTPVPIDTSDIPNDHLGYAIQWFGLATVWAIMSAWLAVRTLRKEDT